jgi:hypothetical protein
MGLKPVRDADAGRSFLVDKVVELDIEAKD